MMLSTAHHMNQIRAECSVKDQCYHIIVLLSPPPAERRVQLQTLCMCVCLKIPMLTTNQFKRMVCS